MQCAGFIVVPECGGCRVISQPMLPLHFKAAVLTEMISERLVSDLHILYASSQFVVLNMRMGNGKVGQIKN
jgi:hypothetical protein